MSNNYYVNTVGALIVVIFINNAWIKVDVNNYFD